MNQGVKAGLREFGFAVLNLTIRGCLALWAATVWFCRYTWRFWYWCARKTVWAMMLFFGPITFILGWMLGGRLKDKRNAKRAAKKRAKDNAYTGRHRRPVYIPEQNALSPEAMDALDYVRRQSENYRMAEAYAPGTDPTMRLNGRQVEQLRQRLHASSPRH